MDLEVARIVHDNGLGPVEGDYLEDFAARPDGADPQRRDLIEEMADELASRPLPPTATTSIGPCGRPSTGSR